MNEYKKLTACFNEIRKITKFRPQTAIILGSGLGKLADNIKIEKIINYSEIEGFPVSTNKAHKGRFVLGYIEEIPVIIMQGRIHYYEGYTMQEVVMPVRLMHMMGAEKLVLTNAAGGIGNQLHKGCLMMLVDHITTFVPSPLIGPNIEELGTRFPDMTYVYDTKMCEIIRKKAKELDIDLKEGIYVQVTGPNYETPAEIKMYQLMGADAVGMSTACEAMTANHMGMKVCGISCITNLAAGISDTELNDAEVTEMADRISYDFEKLIKGIIKEI